MRPHRQVTVNIYAKVTNRRCWVDRARDVTSTKTFKYKYEYKYPSLKYTYKYNYRFFASTDKLLEHRWGKNCVISSLQSSSTSVNFLFSWLYNGIVYDIYTDCTVMQTDKLERNTVVANIKHRYTCQQVHRAQVQVQVRYFKRVLRQQRENLHITFSKQVHFRHDGYREV